MKRAYPRMPGRSPHPARRGKAILAAFGAVVAALLVAWPAQAAFPGANGRIAYAVETYPKLSDAVGSYRVASILPDNTKPRALGPSAAGRVAFSPDGRRIAYADGEDWNNNLWITPVNGPGRSRRVTNLTHGYDTFGSPDWSPSGRRLVFERSSSDGPPELWIHYFNGNRRLTEGASPAWSVNGDIAFTGTTAAGGGIWVIRPDGSGLHRISELGGSPDWSPDGRRIVFMMGRIAVMRADGSHLRQLVTGSAPAFSPDGSQIVFLRGKSVYKMASAGRHVKRLRSHSDSLDWGVRVYAPDWQPRPRRGETLLAPSAAAAPPCESPYSRWDLGAPEQVSFDRVASVSVGHGRNTQVLGARLDYIDANGQAFFSHTFSAPEIASDAPLRFPIRLGADSGQVVVRLTTTVLGAFSQPGPPGYFYAVCDVLTERTVHAFPGHVPRVRLFGDTDFNDFTPALLDLGVDPICELIAPGEFRVLVSHHGRRRALVLRLDPQCPNPADDRSARPGFGWERSGRVIPGLRFRLEGPEGLGIHGFGRRDWIRVYRFDAFWNDRRTLRRWLRVRHRYAPARRIYDDSDSFDLACEETSGEDGPTIHKDKRGYYCVEPGHHETQSRLLRNP